MIIIFWDHKPLLVLLWYYYIVDRVIIDNMENMQHISGTLFRSEFVSCPVLLRNTRHTNILILIVAIVERTEYFCIHSLSFSLSSFITLDLDKCRQLHFIDAVLH